MAITEKLYGFQKGILINGTIAMVTTSGIPSGAEYNAMAKGSLAFDSTAGLTYQKKTSTNSSADWVVIPTTADIAAAVAALGIPWFPDAQVYNNTITTLPTGIATQTITLASGEVVSNNMRVIFAGLTAGKNIYVYDQASGTFSTSIDTDFAGGYRINVPYAWNGTSYVSNLKTYVNVGNATGESIWVEDNDVKRTVLSGLTSSVFVNTTNTTEQAISNLDQTLAEISGGAPVNFAFANLTTSTPVFSLPCRQVKRATYLVTAHTVANEAISDSFYLDVEHDGTATVDATNINTSGRYNDNLGFGTINGFTYTLSLIDPGETQSVILSLSSTDAVSGRVKIVTKIGH